MESVFGDLPMSNNILNLQSFFMTLFYYILCNNKHVFVTCFIPDVHFTLPLIYKFDSYMTCLDIKTFIEN